ncbi:hAT dimerization domain-containing protein [Trifolium repens]|nr:hAT dimerization domain-containing protein [Trifolium repens]
MSSNPVTNGSTAAATIANGGTSVIQNRNTAGKKTDIAWNHGVAIDKTGKKIKCKYCEKIISGGVYRLKHHLAGTQKDVVACTAVPIEVKAQMWDVVASLQQKLVQKTQTAEFEEQIDVIAESRVAVL